MTRVFAYRALTPSGAVTHGEMEADSELDVEARLRASGDFLVEAAEISPRRREEGNPPPPREPSRTTDGAVGRKDLLAFTEYLWGSYKAGISVLTALQDLETQIEGKRMRRIVAEVRASMTEEGRSLSEALAQHPSAFSRLYVGTVEAGEATGQLDFVLEQLVDYLEWQREITLQVRQATLYPALLLGVMGGLVVLLVSFVFPRLLPIFAGFDVELPLPTRIVFSTGTFLREYWMPLLLGVLAVLVAVILLSRSERGRFALDSVKLRLPIFGPLIHQIEMSRVVTYMALFYRTGIDLIRGLTLLEDIVENRRISRAIGEARRAITGGASITQAFAATGLFPPVMIRSFSLGEATGKLDESLERARSFYAREVPAAVRRMLTALQPILIVFLGIILGAIALSVFLPMMRIYQTVGQ